MGDGGAEMNPSIKRGVLYIQYGSELLGVLAKKQCFSCHTFCHGSELLGVLAGKKTMFFLPQEFHLLAGKLEQQCKDVETADDSRVHVEKDVDGGGVEGGGVGVGGGAASAGGGG